MDAIDEIVEHSDTVTRVHDMFVSILQGEERFLKHKREISLAASIHDAWTTDLCWFYRCFTSINGIACCLEDHLYKKFQFEPSLEEERRYARILSSRWSSDSSACVEQKLHDKAMYDDDLARHFHDLEHRRSNDIDSTSEGKIASFT